MFISCAVQSLHFTFYPFICGLSSSVGDTVITFYILPFNIIIHLCSSSCFYKVYLLPFTFHSLPIPVWTEIVLLVTQGLPVMFYSSQSSTVYVILCIKSFRSSSKVFTSFTFYLLLCFF